MSGVNHFHRDIGMEGKGGEDETGSMVDTKDLNEFCSRGIQIEK